LFLAYDDGSEAISTAFKRFEYSTPYLLAVVNADLDLFPVEPGIGPSIDKRGVSPYFVYSSLIPSEHGASKGLKWSFD
jgi:hypothetical protein